MLLLFRGQNFDSLLVLCVRVPTATATRHAEYPREGLAIKRLLLIKILIQILGKSFLFDRIMKDQLFKCCGILFALFNFCFHVADIVTDVLVAFKYKAMGHLSYCYGTVAFIVIPFIYIVFFGVFETGGFEGIGFSASFGYSFMSYLLGPLFPIIFKDRISESNVKKITGFGVFGGGYMEDIPQAAIAIIFFLTFPVADQTQYQQNIAVAQLASSVASGIYKLVSGARTLGGGKINCCGVDCRC